MNGRVQLRRGGLSIRLKPTLVPQSSMLVRLLKQEDLLPAIFFIFSRQVACKRTRTF
jgi:superfamily II RNA helicase